MTVIRDYPQEVTTAWHPIGLAQWTYIEACLIKHCADILSKFRQLFLQDGFLLQQANICEIVVNNLTYRLCTKLWTQYVGVMALTANASPII
jgi:hypothetical protein